MSKSMFTRGWTVIVVVLLAITACTPSAGPMQDPTPQTAASATPTVLPTATVAATTPVPTPDLSRLMSDELTLRDPDAANRAMREFTEWARETSGLRAQLGAQADEIFRLADEAEATAVQDILGQLQPNGKSVGMPAPLPPPWSQSTELRQLVSWVQMNRLLLSPISDVGRYRSSDAEPDGTTAEFDKDVGEGAHAYVKMTTKLVGSRVEGDVEMTIRVEKDGKTYEEKASGKISMNVCPDEQGLVPLDLSYEGGGSSDDFGFNMGFSIHATGHVDDEGNLASIEEEIQVEMSKQTGNTGTNGTASTDYAQINFRDIVKRRTSDNGPSHESHEVSIPGRTTLSEFEESVATFLGPLAVITAKLAFMSAESEWQTGSCVAIVVPEESQQVDTGSETSFTAKVQHKFEGTELAVPVVATLDSGAVSVTPSNTKVPAPATFIYKAPDEEGEASVKLVSKSRRGIGKLTVRFETVMKYYTVDGAFGGCDWISVSGRICALDKPFTLEVNGADPINGKYTGEITFTPTGMSGGSWTHTATACTPEGECGTINASGTYRVEGVADGEPVIITDPTTESMTAFGMSKSLGMPAWQIKPELTYGDCSEE